jgi:hypothetical protein
MPVSSGWVSGRRPWRDATAVGDEPARPPAGGTAAALCGVDRGLFQVVALLWIYALYDLLRVGVRGSTAAATAHAHQVAALEHSLGLGAERALQQGAMRLPWLVGACNAYYAMGHLAVPPIVLLILYRRAPARYRHWRNVFLVMLGLALVTFWLYPVAPPRLMAGPGQVIDTSRAYFSFNQTPLGALGARTGSSAPTWAGGTNPFAAMPSLHVGWALWSALALWPVVRRRWTRLLLALYPMVMVLVVLVTGNHWLVDALAAGAVTALAAALVTAGSRGTRRLTSTTGAESPADDRAGGRASAAGLEPFGVSVATGPRLR